MKEFPDTVAKDMPQQFCDQIKRLLEIDPSFERSAENNKVRQASLERVAWLYLWLWAIGMHACRN